jgi:two-component system OmpR family response regulator
LIEAEDKKLKRIMYVDDDPDLQQIVRLGLEIGGSFNVKTCESGEQALEEVDNFKPDLILMDVVMEGLSGTKTLEKLRKNSSAINIPVVFLTSKLSSAQLSHYKELGALGVIKKPLNPMKLTGQVNEVWQKFLEQREF